MKVIVQIKFNSRTQRVVKFDDLRYLVYICSEKESPNAMNEFLELMSREFSISQARIKYLGKKGEGYLLEVK